MKYILLSILLFIACNNTYAKPKYYKWTDKNGNIHYTEKKPQGTDYEELKVSSKAPKQAPKEENTENEKSDIPDEQKAVNEYNKNQQELAKKAQDEANCKIAKANLETLQNQRRVKRVNPATGEEVYIDPSNIDKMIQQIRQSIQEYCK